jgi:NADH:ubiquinone oxidoreductase subunit 4 (subunit M)
MVTRSSREAPRRFSYISRSSVEIRDLWVYSFLVTFVSKASFSSHHLFYTIAAGYHLHSFTAIRQTDFKRIIAYTSIAHMNLVILGIFSFNTVGLEGAIVQSLSHGFVASALFVIIGVVYDRYRTRIVKYYGGLATVMPIYITIFLFLPYIYIFLVVELWRVLILAGSFKVNTTITF